MYKLALTLSALGPNLGAARLKCLEVRTGRNLLVGALAGQPHFDVIGLSGGEAQVSRAQHYCSVRQFQALQNVFCVARQFLVLFVALVGCRKLDEFYFLELMLPDDSPYVSSV